MDNKITIDQIKKASNEVFKDVEDFTPKKVRMGEDLWGWKIANIITSTEGLKKFNEILRQEFEKEIGTFKNPKVKPRGKNYTKPKNRRK